MHVLRPTKNSRRRHSAYTTVRAGVAAVLVGALWSPFPTEAHATGQTAEGTAPDRQSATATTPLAPSTNELQAPQATVNRSGEIADDPRLNPPPAATSEYSMELAVQNDVLFVPESGAVEAAEPSAEMSPAPVTAQIEAEATPVEPETAPAAPAVKQEPDYNVPIVMDAKVEGHIRFFNYTIRDKFEKWLLRLSHYHPLVEQIFMEFGLPTDLVYLSLVESGFNPHAYSRARATGPWQFMKGTGKLYGLRVDKYVDERRDPIKSTVAAARYLRDLYDLFGSWPLAMAAYNAGEGKVMRALRKSQSESFSEIAETRHIRRETKEYVPRFMAATVIAKNPDRYGFQLGEVDPHEFEEVIVGRSMHLRSIAAASGVKYETLRMLNPELRLEATPPDDPRYHLKVPVGSKKRIENVLDRVPSWKAPRHLPSTKTVKAKPNRGGSRKWYKVRNGDTLASIAKRFNLTVSALKERNNISARQLRAGDLLSIR